MPQRRAINDDGSPETPDGGSWDGDAVDAAAGEDEPLDVGGWIHDAARLREPGEEDGPEEGSSEEAAPEEGSAGSPPEEGPPAAPEVAAPVEKPAEPDAGVSTGGGEESGGDASPEEGGARPEGPVGRRTAFVEAIVADPANPPAVRLLAGYVGAAAEKGSTRLYLDLALGRWIDLPNGDVLHAVKEGPGRLARTLVWVRAGSAAFGGGTGGEDGAEMRDEGPFHAP